MTQRIAARGLATYKSKYTLPSYPEMPLTEFILEVGTKLALRGQRHLLQFTSSPCRSRIYLVKKTLLLTGRLEEASNTINLHIASVVQQRYADQRAPEALQWSVCFREYLRLAWLLSWGLRPLFRITGACGNRIQLRGRLEHPFAQHTGVWDCF